MQATEFQDVDSCWSQGATEIHRNFWKYESIGKLYENTSKLMLFAFPKSMCYTFHKLTLPLSHDRCLRFVPVVVDTSDHEALCSMNLYELMIVDLCWFSWSSFLWVLGSTSKVASASRFSKLFRTASACNAVAVWGRHPMSVKFKEFNRLEKEWKRVKACLESESLFQVACHKICPESPTSITNGALGRLIAELIEDYGAGPETLRDTELMIMFAHHLLSFSPFCPF